MVTKMANLLNMLEWDGTIFDNLDLPSEFDGDLFKYLIVEHLGDRTPIYGNPALFKFNIQNWFTYKKPIFQKLWETMNYEYNPIENYDRKEESVRDSAGRGSQLSTSQTERDNAITQAEGTKRNLKQTGDVTTDYTGTDTHATGGTDRLVGGGTDTEKQSGSDSLAHTGTIKEGHTGTDTSTHNVSAFNETGYQTDTQDKTEHGETVTNTYNDTQTTNYGKNSTITYGKTDTTTYGKTDTETRNLKDTDKRNLNDDEKIAHEFDTGNIEKLAGANTLEHENENSEYVKLRAHGNIGVTTTQTMIEEQRRVVQFHVYDFVINMFENKFFICAW